MVLTLCFCVTFWSHLKNVKVHIWLFTLKILLWVWHQLGKVSRQQEVGTSHHHGSHVPSLNLENMSDHSPFHSQTTSESSKEESVFLMLLWLFFCAVTQLKKWLELSYRSSDSFQWSIQLCSWRAWPLDVECGVTLFPCSTWDMGVLPQGPQLCPGCHGAPLCLASFLLHRSVLKASLSSANVKGCLWGTSLDMFLNRSWSSGSQCWLLRLSCRCYKDGNKT